MESDETPRRWNVFYDIDILSRSRTDAYYFLNDNRRVLDIPPHQDLIITDLYGARKYGRNVERLPREIVIEYLWQESFVLEGAEFRHLQGAAAELTCGGTLVLDELGNVLSWAHKPGTESRDHHAKGEVRMARLRAHLARQIRRGQIGMRGDTEVDAFGPWTPPVVADTEGGVLTVEIAPHLRNTMGAVSDDEQAGPAKPDDPVRQLGGQEWSVNF